MGVLGIVAAGISAISGIMGGFAQSAAMRQQAAGAQYNAAVARQNALAVQKAGAYQEQIQREKNLRFLGAQKQAYGKSGVTMEGTPLDVMASTATGMEQDILAQRYNTNVAAWRYQSQAGMYDYEASSSESMSMYPAVSGMMGGAATLLGGGARYYYGGQYASSPYASGKW